MTKESGHFLGVCHNPRQLSCTAPHHHNNQSKDEFIDLGVGIYDWLLNR